MLISFHLQLDKTNKIKHIKITISQRNKHWISHKMWVIAGCWMDIINISSLYMYQEKLALEQDVKRRLQEIQNLQDQVKAGEVTLAYFFSFKAFIWI